MPNRFVSYNVPPPPKTGNKEVDDALGQWALALSGQQQGNMLDQERLPYVQTVFATSNSTFSAAPFKYISSTLQLLGGESVLVHGTLTVDMNGAAVGQAYLRIIFPNGTSQRLTNYPIKLNGSGSRTRTWPVTPEYMTGGRMRFDLICSGDGTVTDGSLVIDVR